MATNQVLEIPVKGMDCVECTQHVKHAIAALPGVSTVEVFLASEKALVEIDTQLVDLPAIQKAVETAGYTAVVDPETEAELPQGKSYTRAVLTLLGAVFAIVIFVIVVGEWLGLFAAITSRVPWPLGWALVLAGGYPVFLKVARAAVKGQVISHTLMTLGVLAALLVGEWATAIVVVLFMRVGDYVESFTAERARRAVKDLTRMAPQTARVVRDDQEIELPVAEVRVGETVIVRPGELVPVDGEVISGYANIDQAAITGESMPVDAGPGSFVYAAGLAHSGSLRVRASHVGTDTTFGRVIKLVEQAEAHRADVQRVADRFSTYYLPLVAGIAALTFLLGRDPLATAAVLVVACSCAFALATPIAMLASIGAGAKRGLMIKGGKYLETLSQADVLLIDKTGTLTLGKPELVDIHLIEGAWESNGHSQDTILQMAATVERYSEHPLAQAVRNAASARGLALDEPENFESLPGMGARGRVRGVQVDVGNRRMFAGNPALAGLSDGYDAQGKSVFFVALDGEPVAVLGAADTLRSDAPQAIREMRSLGIAHIELLTGDNRRATESLVGQIETAIGEAIDFRADLLPEDKIEIVKTYQAKDHRVIMVGDGVNDAPALAQADVGIAMGAAGSAVAIEAAHIALMRDDWALLPGVMRIARRTMRVVKMNIAFTAVYNIAGLLLAAFGFLPPILAAAAQSLPDIGILANSSRLLRQK